MRFVTKGICNDRHLANAHANPPLMGSDARSRWSNFQRHKQDLLRLLLEEQYHLCGYSEVRADLLQLGYHIEHVQPKSQYPARTFDYANLMASALDSDDLGHFKVAGDVVFAGHAKGSIYDPAMFVSCYQVDCARYFSYLSDGRIVPAKGLSPTDNAKADYTIKLLALDSPFLEQLRQAWWDDLEQLFAQHVADDWSIEHLAMIDLLPVNGKLSPFFSLTRQFFGAVAEQLLQHHAPELV